MAQINIFTGKEETERVYMKPEKARKIIETNKDNLIAIMGLRQQYPDVIDITSHYILVKPNTLTDMAGEAQILCFKTTGKEYAQ